jgi:RHS repeat-associated protein
VKSPLERQASEPGPKTVGDGPLRPTKEDGPEQRGLRAPGASEGAEADFLLEAPSISLPKGGGAIQGIDEKFTVNPSNGTVSLSLPLPFTPGRNGFVPPVSLSYDSGTGNSVVGLGWSLAVGSIRRRTDQQLPTYGDDDVFVVAGAEDLLPTVVWDGNAWTEPPTPAGPDRVRRFRPRVERGFARIEQLSDDDLGSWWRVTSRDNVTTYFGTDDDSRLADPLDRSRVFEWLPSCSVDDKGNVVLYEWVAEDLAGVGPSLADANRRTGMAPFANLHLKRVRYGNRTPVFVDADDPYRPPATDGEFLFEVVLDYGEHDRDDPGPDPLPGRTWPARPDAFSSYRPGWDLRTNRLLRRVLVFHRFDELDGGAPTLVRSLDLSYAPSSGGHGPGGEVTNLVAATTRGYIRKPDGTYAVESLPPTEFEYEPVAWDDTVRTVDPASVAGLPAGTDGQYQWIDLFGEGLVGIFSEHQGGWRYKRNLGDVDETGAVTLDVSRPVVPKPSVAGVARGVVQVHDLDADGRRQVVVRAPGLEGFFEFDDIDGWRPFTPFQDCLCIDLHDRHVRALDLVGDGRAHLLVSEQDAFVWYRSAGTRGHLPGGRVPKAADEERGPTVVFADSTQSVFLADMTGDRLADIVRVRNGEVCYWPNLGYGRFGAKVTTDAAPRVDQPDQFDGSRVHLVDLTGTGAADLVYVDRLGCTAWLNLSGNRWSAGQRITVPFAPSAAVNLSTTDLLGNGTTCLVWSSSLPADADAPIRYVDPMAGKKPHLLRRYSNNLGKQVALSYKSSTWFRLRDERNGRRWRTRLAFPVHCVRRVETLDLVSGTRLVTDYRYHHGCYDVVEREFRGFGMVEQLDAEDVEHWARGPDDTLVDRSFHCPPTLTRTWFHTGVAGDHGTLLARYRDEYWDAEMRRAGFEELADEPDLPDGRLVAGPGAPPGLLDGLGPAGRREALRACKGLVLRSEVFALDAPPGAGDDARRRELSPYTVVTRSHQVTVLQPPVAGRHAVFSVHESESLTRNYERVLTDPRVVHHLNVRVDEVGNVLEAAAVAYGRRVADLSLPPAVRALQQRPRITYARNEFTNDVSDPVDHRVRLGSRSTTFEVRGLAPAAAPLFRLADFDRAGFHVLADSTEVPHHDDTVPAPGTVTRRLLAAGETRYLDGSLATPRPLHDLDPRGLVSERYELAFTPELLAHVYGDRVTAAQLTEGGYVVRDGAHWVPSGRHAYLLAGEAAAAARGRFFTPVAHVDAFGARTDIRHHGDTWLLVSEVEDAVGNRTRVDAFDFRRLAPVRTVDPNDNVGAVLLDPLGRVKASALMGKGDEGDTLDGLSAWATPEEAAAVTAFLASDSSVDLTTIGKDLLGSASARYLHDAHALVASGGASPPVLATITREQHAAVQLDAPVQVSFEYANGSGKVELHKVQAEAGLARHVTVQPGGKVLVEEVDTAALVPPRLRWLGNGREVRDAKGRVVKEYEPFFSTTPRFENAKELVETGVAHLRTYDPLDRLVRVDHPDGTLSRTEPGAWRTVEHDRNDTVTESDWHRRRVNHEIDAELLAEGKDPAREAEAAHRTEPHAGTPFTRHLDPLGRPVLEVQHAGRDDNGVEVLLPTTYLRELVGRILAVVDARDLPTIAYDRDLRGTLAAYRSADGGNRWMLADVRGEPLRSWDQRDHAFTFAYDDPLHRLTHKRVQGGDSPVPLDHVFERRVYGEGLPDDTTHNLRTRVAVLYDTGGKVESLAFDFKGNLVSSARRFAADHRGVPDWSGADPDALLAPATFTSTASYDALGRVVERTTADGSEYRPSYNPANLLETVTVTRNGTPAVHVKGIDYDELARRRRIVFGNDVAVDYAYDRETFRLLALATRTGDGTLIQDLHYTYDPEGNVTHLEDRCVPTVWFANQMVTGLSTYRYDPLYRLAEASGREHIGQVDFGTADNWTDAAFVQRLDPGDALAWRNFTQRYHYDQVGNLTEVEHGAGSGSWTRGYTYAADSNRLLSTRVGGTDYPCSSHPAHGYVTGMPHLSLMRWGFRDELRAVATQVVTSGTPETTWYVYDGDGKRVRKVVERAAAEGADPVRKVERFYLDGVEIAVEYDGTGAPAKERRTFHVNDDHQRVALLETEHDPGDPVPTTRLVRYQSPDHLDSAQLETDDAGNVIAYELFHPFGTTAYQATAKALGPAARRYRYTGMERDEESGFEYHGARYYAPWLGRWIAPDEHPETLDGNRYAYVKNNPMVYRDPNGRFEEPVHGALTYRLALAAGFSSDDAATIAIATAGMDHNAATSPGDTKGEMQLQILKGITQIQHYPTQEVALQRVQEDIDLGLIDLAEFGRHLHSLEDVGFKDAPGPHNRSSVRLLTPAVLLVGAVAVGLGVLVAFGASAAFSAGGAWAVLGAIAAVAAVALFAFALYAVIFAVVARGTGHPSYKTEKMGWSHFFRHTADRAFSDPDANTKEMLRIYDLLKQAAKAVDPKAVADDAAAAAAIKETVEAKTEAAINRLFNTAARDSKGNLVPSYGEIRTRAPWTDREPDVSLNPTKGNPEGKFHYQRLKPVPVH